MTRSNSDELTALNERNLYPDGIMDYYIPDVLWRTVRPAGAAYPGPSDYRKTFVDAATISQSDQIRQGRGFAHDRTGDPWNSDEPGITQMSGSPELAGPEAGLPSKLSHEPHPQDTRDPKSMEGDKALTLLTGGNPLEAFKALWRSNPVAALFFALGGIYLANTLVLKSGSVRNVRRAGTSAITAPARTSTAAGKSTIDSLNDTIDKGVKGLSDLAP